MTESSVSKYPEMGYFEKQLSVKSSQKDAYIMVDENEQLEESKSEVNETVVSWKSQRKQRHTT